jgi:sialate O-acetylesterase
VAGFFAMNLLHDLKIPVGILSSSWGGCRIEPWIPLESFERIKGNADGARAELDEAQIQDLAKRVWDMDAPGLMYNAMVHPFAGFAMRGAIWYQGESNVGDAYWYQKRPYSGDGFYDQKMGALIGGWRKAWNIGDFPFYFVQLAPYRKYTGEPLGRMWEIQAEIARSVVNTGMASATDSKEFRNIHPNNKEVVGKRLALLALAKTYGKNVAYSGPIYRDSRIEENRMIIEFDHAGSGLAFSGEKITDVFIKGESDMDFVEAAPTLEGNKLVVTHPAGRKPLHVRMGWNKDAMPNLMNKEGLPASPFRTDEK